MKPFTVELKATPILFEFDKKFISEQKIFTSQRVGVDALTKINDGMDAYWLQSDECVIYSYFKKELLEKLNRRIWSDDRKDMKRTLKQMVSHTDNNSISVVQTYERIKRKLIKRVESRRLNRYLNSITICRKSSIKTLINRFGILTEIPRLKLESSISLKEISKKLRIPVSRVYHLWRILKNFDKDSIIKMNNSLLVKIGIQDYLHKIFLQVKESSTLQLSTVKTLYEQSLENCSYDNFINYSAFYKSFKEFGFRYQNIQYKPRVKRMAVGVHLKNFLDFYLFILTRADRFLVVYIDESSVCPSN